MKAIKKFLALLLTAVMAFTVVPVFAAQSSSVPEKALSAGRLYGYRVFDDDDTLSYAWISFTADNPAAVTEEQVEENAFDDYTNMNCGAYVNGYVYGFAENGYFYRVNTADWSRERLFADASSYNGWSDMTFDYTTGKLYAVAYNLPWDSGDDETAIEASFLVTIDLHIRNHSGSTNHNRHFDSCGGCTGRALRHCNGRLPVPYQQAGRLNTKHRQHRPSCILCAEHVL
ncbi:MAG: hypothetical protein ACLUZ4_05010 [Christensenellaceae bacterium]